PASPRGMERSQLPPDLQAALANSERLGREIYEQDQATWQATDAARDARLLKPPLQGWLSVRTEAGWLVRFVAPCAEGMCASVDVELPTAGQTVVRQRPVPEPLAGAQAAMWSARQLAARSPFKACSEHYNTVILSGERDGAPVWQVYLLAASEDADV